MPIFEYRCECGCKSTELQREAGAPMCKCGETMQRLWTPLAMVKWKDEGGYPSLRKAHLRTAPFTSHYGPYGD